LFRYANFDNECAIPNFCFDALIAFTLVANHASASTFSQVEKPKF